MLRSGSVAKMLFPTPGNFTWKNEAGTLDEKKQKARK
jgi:hypothetical protein